jgi:hypothetical protein
MTVRVQRPGRDPQLLSALGHGQAIGRQNGDPVPFLTAVPIRPAARIAALAVCLDPLAFERLYDFSLVKRREVAWREAANRIGQGCTETPRRGARQVSGRATRFLGSRLRRRLFVLTRVADPLTATGRNARFGQGQGTLPVS